MKRQTPMTLTARLRLAALLVLAILIVSDQALPQIASSGSQAPASKATQLPLSGRTTQNGSVTATQTAVPGTTTSVNTLNPAVQVQGAYAGSTGSTATLPFSGRLCLAEAIQRGLAYNLGAVGLAQAVRQAHGQTRVARSALLPNLNGNLTETVEEINLRALGVRFQSPIPGIAFPTIVGPFNFFDLRARLSQTVMDLTAWNNYHSATESLRANQLSAQDARDLVVLAVGGAYLQVIAAQARVLSGRAQLETANALYEQAFQQRQVGVTAQVDVDRSRVQALTQKQRLVSLQNDLAKQKINMARITGLRPTDQYEISNDVPFSPAPALSEEDAVQQAFAKRADIKSAEAQVRAASRALSAARAERYPSLAINADYGVIGINPAQSHGTFSVAGTLRFPIWEGGQAEGHMEQAAAVLAQRQAELDDTRLEVEGEVHKAYLDLQAASSQVEVAQENLQVAKETLELTRQRVDAGVANSVELVQSQESLATADLDYINSVFAHNLAKLSLARALGRAAESLPQFLTVR